MQPFRSAAIQCPRCRTEALTEGDLRHCGRCKGSWVPEEVLHAHIATMTSEPVPDVRWTVTHKRLGLPCAVCKHTMETLLLFDIAVDRCHSHGVWFDKDELANVLLRSTVERKQPGDPGVALAVGDVAGDAAIIVADAAVTGIFEGVLDVLGGIFSAIDF